MWYGEENVEVNEQESILRGYIKYWGTQGPVIPLPYGVLILPRGRTAAALVLPPVPSSYLNKLRSATKDSTQPATTTTNPRYTMLQTVTATLYPPSSPAIMLRTPRDTQDYFQDAPPSSPSASTVHASSPEQLVDKALHALEKAGVQLIEWKSLLYRRMGVPVILKVHGFNISSAIYC